MTAVIVPDASVTIPVTRADVDANGMLGGVEIRNAVRKAVEDLGRAVRR